MLPHRHEFMLLDGANLLDTDNKRIVAFAEVRQDACVVSGACAWTPAAAWRVDAGDCRAGIGNPGQVVRLATTGLSVLAVWMPVSSAMRWYRPHG